MLTKYATPEVGLEVLDVQRVPANAGHRRQAHRAVFDYTPRPGYIYVRSRAISSRCNDNFDEFPASEIKKAFRTFVGKPVFVNHHNSDHRRARGVIIDAALHEDTNPDGSDDTWAEVLMEVDAKRFPVLAREVKAGNIARTSMGTDVEYSVCTACGNKAYTPADYCVHIPRMKGMKIRRVNAATGRNEQVLIAERCYGLRFFENSLLVEDPADPTAFGWLDYDASGDGIDKAAAREVIEEAEHYVREAASPMPKVAVRQEDLLVNRPNIVDVVREEMMRREAFPSRRDMVDQLEGHQPHGEQVTRARPASQPVRQQPEIGTSSKVPHGPGFGGGSIEHINETGDESTARFERQHRRQWNQYHPGEAYQPTHDEQVLDSRAHPHPTVGSLQSLAYGEVKAPANVDTMRAENCPVCGDDEGFTGEKCNVCGYVQPPSQFRDPDLTKAREVDLRQEQAEQAGADPEQGINPNGPTDAQAPGASQPDQSQPETLECTNCGEVFSAEGDAATSPDATEPGVEQDPAKAQEADPQHPGAPTDPNSQKADKPDDLSDLADSSDAELGLEDDPDEKQDDEEEDDPDKVAPPPAQGEGRVTPEVDPQQQPQQPNVQQDPKQQSQPDDQQATQPDQQQKTDLSDIEIAPNMTCPVCGQGTLVPVAVKPAGDEPDLNEIGQTPDSPTKMSRRTRSTDMNQPNPAQQHRNRIIAAIQEQQGMIEDLQRENAGLRNAVAHFAVAAHVGDHPVFAPIVRAAGLQRSADSNQSPEGAPATTTEEAKKPDATDDVNSVGAAPGSVNSDVTPKATTDVQNSNVAADSPVLDNLQDVTAPTSGTDSPTPAAGDAAGASQVSVGTPSNDSFDTKTWAAKQRGDDQQRFVASMRLARLRIASKIETGEDLAVAQKIAESDQTLGEIEAQVNALAAVAQHQSTAPTAEQQRRLVPRRAAQQQGVVPVSLQATAATTSRAGDDEWMIGNVE